MQTHYFDAFKDFSFYTCASGETTVLHATEYDVCERCFVDFAVDGRSDGALPQTRRVGAR